MPHSVRQPRSTVQGDQSTPGADTEPGSTSTAVHRQFGCAGGIIRDPVDGWKGVPNGTRTPCIGMQMSHGEMPDNDPGPVRHSRCTDPGCKCP